ncbi:unnamed protein product [Allacma fusca]|uniref:Uncharacterized protein n=1 Tax=Allacma fusca TaxID=39272 RepID=A0A8J2KVW2_9HEXA|nr:unnamed protein product [Allacma fusca]
MGNRGLASQDLFTTTNDDHTASYASNTFSYCSPQITKTIENSEDEGSAKMTSNKSDLGRIYNEINTIHTELGCLRIVEETRESYRGTPEGAFHYLKRYKGGTTQGSPLAPTEFQTLQMNDQGNNN